MKKLFAVACAIAVSFGNASAMAVGPTTTAKPAKTVTAKNLVEQDVLSMQQDGVRIVRGLLDQYLSKDWKESGNLDFGVSLDSPYGTGSVRLTLDRYVSVMNVLKGNQEADYQGKLHIDVHPSSALSGTGNNAISGDVKFSVNVKVIDKDAYVTLGSIAFDIQSSDASVMASIDEAKTEAAKYVGKTIHFAGAGNGANAADVIKKTNLVLDILDSNPLFSVHSKLANGYRLKLNARTFQKIAKALGKDGRTIIGKLDFTKSVLKYEKTAGGDTVLSAAETSPRWKGMNKLTRKSDGSYAFDSNATGKGYNKGTSVSLHLERNNSSLLVKDTNSTLSATYANEVLDLSSVWTGMEYTDGDFATVDHSFLVHGGLTIDTADLTASYDGTPIGTLVVTKNGTSSYQTKLKLDMTVAKEMRLVVDLLENVTLEYGSFDITAPTDYVEADSLN